MMGSQLFVVFHCVSKATSIQVVGTTAKSISKVCLEAGSELAAAQDPTAGSLRC